MQDKVRKLLEKIEPDLTLPTPIPSQLMRQVLERWQEQLEVQGLVFVYGKGRRKSAEQRSYELLADCVERSKKYEEDKRIFDGRNSFSKTDHDATFMHLKDDYMRNSQFKPAYNVQVGVESEYIVGVDISSERNDLYTLKPFLERLESNYECTFDREITDAGYESEEPSQY